MTDFPKWLKRQIEIRDMTQAEFAEKGSITPSQVSHVIKGQRNPGEDFYKATATALEMPLIEVYKVAGIIPPENGSAKFPFSDEEMRVVHLMREMAPEQRRQVVEFAEFLRTRGQAD